MTVTIEQANESVREAVAARMAATPQDDPKCVGYKIDQGDPDPEPCCEGTRMRGDSLLADQGENYSQWEPAFAEQPPAVQTLHDAIAAVRDRHTKYGPPVEHFSRTASLVNAAFGTTFTPSDWALVMVLDKIARQLGPQATNDAAIDIAGYAACHQECRRG
jgi:hypothetical protein